MESLNLIVRAKENVEFYQCGSSGEGFASLGKGCASKDTVFLASAAYEKDFPSDKFEILEKVEVKKDFDICPCCVSDIKYFDIDLTKYPNIVHINELTLESIGWVPYERTRQYMIVRGKSMMPD